MTENMDEKILELAQEIKAETGVSLTDAMIRAEAKLAPKDELPEYFEVRIRVKPRVARWILSEFGGHPEHSIEERLGAYVSSHMGRARTMAIQYSREAPEISDQGAVSMRRDQFKEKAPAS